MIRVMPLLMLFAIMMIGSDLLLSLMIVILIFAGRLCLVLLSDQ